MKEIMIHREEKRRTRKFFYKLTKRKEKQEEDDADVGVIQRSTSFDNERFFKSSGEFDVALEDP